MTILITGANRGLGLALLDGYRGEGRAAIGTARRAQAGLEPLDVNDPASVRSLAAGLAGQPIDTLICNGQPPEKYVSFCQQHGIDLRY